MAAERQGYEFNFQSRAPVLVEIHSNAFQIVRDAIVQVTSPGSLEGNSLPLSVQSSASPIVIWLSGHAQTNDKLAMKEIGRQLVLQTGSNDLAIPDEDEGGSDDEFEDEKDPVGIAHLSSILVCPH